MSELNRPLTRRAGVALLLALVVTGCSVKTPAIDEDGTIAGQRQRVVQLEHLFLSLDSRVDAGEARGLAAESMAYAYRLSERYRLVWPPLWHNTLVNLGLKERGLCHQWADDMLAHVKAQGYRTFDLYLGVSGRGTFWEHNTLVVSAKGGSFEQGVVLDAWRNSGDLYFAKVGEDEKYNWSERHD